MNSPYHIILLVLGVVGLSAAGMFAAGALSEPDRYTAPSRAAGQPAAVGQSSNRSAGSAEQSRTDSPRDSSDDPSSLTNSANSTNSTDSAGRDSWTARYLEMAAEDPAVKTLQDLYDSGDSELNQRLTRRLLAHPDIKRELREDRFYTAADLSGDEDGDRGQDGAAARRQYGNAMAEIFLRYDFKAARPAEESFDRLIDSRSADQIESYRRELLQLRSYFRDLQADLLALPVPSGAEETHLELLNTGHLLERRLSGMLLYERDPVRAALSADTYPESRQRFLRAYDDLAAYLRTGGVTFTQGDPGYQLWR